MTTNSMILNQTSSSNFVMDIPDNDTTKGLTLQIQGVTLPGINIPVSTVPLNAVLPAHIPGSAIEFDPLIVRMVVDEELKSYLGVYQWMLGTVNYTDMEKSIRWLEADQSLAIHVLDNSKSKTIGTFRFFGAWPSNLGEIELSYTDDSDEPVTCMVTFNFKYMEIEMNGVVVRPEPRKKK